MFFDLLLFPCGIEEGDEVEGGQPVQSQGNAPAECRPDGPELMRAGDEIDHDQHGDDHDILRDVQIEFLDLSHAFECDGFLGFSYVASVSRLADWPRSMRWMVRTLSPLTVANCSCDQPRCSLSFCTSIILSKVRRGRHSRKPPPDTTSSARLSGCCRDGDGLVMAHSATGGAKFEESGKRVSQKSRPVGRPPLRIVLGRQAAFSSSCVQFPRAAREFISARWRKARWPAATFSALPPQA